MPLTEMCHTFDEQKSEYCLVFENEDRTVYFPTHDNNPGCVLKYPSLGRIVYGKEPLGKGITCYEVKVEDGDPCTAFAVGISEKPEGPTELDREPGFMVWSNGHYVDENNTFKRTSCKPADRSSGKPVVYKILLDRPKGTLYTILNQELVHVVKRDFANWKDELFLYVYGFGIKVTMTYAAVSKEKSLGDLAEAQVLERIRKSDIDTKELVFSSLPECIAKILKWKVEMNNKYDSEVFCSTRNQ